MNYLQSIVLDTHDKQTSQVIFVMSWKGLRGRKHSTPSYNTRNSRFRSPILSWREPFFVRWVT